jgi:regulator of protease activity HflC (stomatin/prohibitin superfamily)
MRKELCLLILALLMITFAGCSRVDSGYVGVKVYMLGGNKGVDNEVVGVGYQWVGFNEELYCYPTFQINYTYTKDENEGSPTNEEFVFQTSEGMECSMDIGVALHFNKEKVAQMFQTYRKGPDEIRGTVVRNAIRDALNKTAGTMPVESIYGSGKSKLIDSVQTIVKSLLESNGIIIDRLSLIGSIRIPDQVLQALNSKVTATQNAQKAENQLREAEANARKLVAAAEGEAQANKIKMSSLTSSVIEWQKIENEKQAIAKWNGQLPTMMTGNAVPFINVNAK